MGAECIISGIRPQIAQTIVHLGVELGDVITKATLADAFVSAGTVVLSQEEEVRPGDYVSITVADTGHGMMPSTLRRAFEPFFTTKGSGKGTGLGLSMVYGLVKQSGGYIRARSEPARGTRIEVLLPRVEQPAPPVDEPKPTRLPYSRPTCWWSRMTRWFAPSWPASWPRRATG